MSAHCEQLLHAANRCIYEGDEQGAAIFMALLEREMARAKK